MHHLYHSGTLFAHFLGHFLGRTSYDVTVEHDSSRFLCLYKHLKKKKESQLPLRSGMSRFCQVAGKHSPAGCNAPSACTASVKCVLAFWVAFTRYFMDSVLILILLDNSCLIFVLFFIARLWERYFRAHGRAESWCFACGSWRRGGRLFPVGYT